MQEALICMIDLSLINSMLTSCLHTTSQISLENKWCQLLRKVCFKCILEVAKLLLKQMNWLSLLLWDISLKVTRAKMFLQCLCLDSIMVFMGKQLPLYHAVQMMQILKTCLYFLGLRRSFLNWDIHLHRMKNITEVKRKDAWIILRI